MRLETPVTVSRGEYILTFARMKRCSRSAQLLKSHGLLRQQRIRQTKRR